MAGTPPGSHFLSDFRERSLPSGPIGPNEFWPSGAGDLHPNYRYMLSWAAPLPPGARILDFGCGSGDVVAAGRARGLDITGAELFTGVPGAREEALRRGLLGDRVLEIRDGRLPFPDGHFDLALSNTVFEHVQDLEGAIGELWRVLREGGRLVAFFPTREVVREGHFGLLFVHWLPRGSRLRRAWATASRRAGFGRHKEGIPVGEWARQALDWMDRYTVYRPLGEVAASFRRRFRVSFGEVGYLRFRLEARPGLQRLVPLLRVPWIGQAASFVCRRWGGVVLLASKGPPGLTSSGAPGGSRA